MKNNIIIILIFFCNFIHSQVTTTIEKIFVGSQATVVQNCNTIDIGYNENTSLTIHYKLTKPSNQAVSGYLRVFYKNQYGIYVDFGGVTSIQVGDWTNNSTEVYGIRIVNVSYNMIQSNNTIKIEFETSSTIKTSSCDYPIIKQIKPTFSVNPSIINLECGDISSKLIQLTPHDIPTGSNYNFNFNQSGWNVTQVSTNSFNFTPLSGTNLPSNIIITLNVNGFPPFQKTISIQRANFIRPLNLTDLSLCTTRTYTLNGLLTGDIIEEFTLINNNNVATIINTIGNQITVNRVSDGTFGVKVKLRNQCNQTYETTFLRRSGKPAGFSPSATINGPSTVLTGALSQYSINEALPLGATSYEWWLPHPFDNVTTFDYNGQRWQKYANQNGEAIQVFTGLGKINGLVQVMAKNECGCGGAKTLSVSHQSRSTGGSSGGGIVKPGGSAIPRLANSNEFLEYTNINIFPNPITEVLNVELLNEFDNLSKVEDVNIEIIDLQGKKVRNITEKSNKFSINVNDLSKGIYLLKINIKDKTDTQKIVIQ